MGKAGYARKGHSEFLSTAVTDRAAGDVGSHSAGRPSPRHYGIVPVDEPGRNGIQGNVVSFGPFRLFPAERTLEKNGIPLALGSRALDILIVLAERAGVIVTARELIARVWRGLVVDPGNLRVHITGLRKALDDGEQKTRYIVNVPGQGYCFVAPVERLTAAGPPARTAGYPCGAARKRLILPPVLSRMVGRDETVRRIGDDLIADRFVSVIGPGGIGKTTVAVSVAHAMREEFADAVCFVDVGAVTNPELVPATVASALGLTIQTANVLPTLMECLKSLRILLALDNCEHVIDAAATLAELIFREAQGVHILATSREALRVEGERAYWLPPLDSPPPGSSMKAVDVLKFPAVQLFVERAAAAGGRFELTDTNAPAVAGICGRLDGMALAIELAASRVGSHGITETVGLLASGLGLDWRGRRTALPRHQTLRALLDWSYGSLGDLERIVLGRLSIFVGTFTIEAVRSVCCGNMSDELLTITTFDSLVAKSLVSVSVADDNVTRYRLLATTRDYAREKLEESGERQATARRHAAYFAHLLDNACGGEVDPHQDSRAVSLAEHLGNVRAALDWCFGHSESMPSKYIVGNASRAPADGPTANDVHDAALGVELAAASIPLFLELSLLNECYKRSMSALAVLDDAARGSRLEMVLQEARAITSTWTRGNGEDVREAIARGLTIAERLGETAHHLRLLVGMHMFLVRAGSFRDSLVVAEKLAAVARNEGDESFMIISDWLRGSSEHFIGNQAAAQQHFRRGFARPGPRNVQLFGLDCRVRALVPYARVLWLRGAPDRAMEVAREAIDEAAEASKPLNVCFSFLYTAAVFLWCGDLGAANDVLQSLMAHPNWRALPSLHATGLALKGELLARLGDAEQGIPLLERSLENMRSDGQKILVARTACALAESLAASDRLNEARNLVCDAIAECAADEEAIELPELLRIKGTILLAMAGTDEAEGEDCLTQSLACARRQFSASWELRTAITLARLRAKQGRDEQARQLLSSVYDRFTEGFGTSDLKAAAQLLRELH
ncbi:MAG: ATP-binding protein [Gammaproteobacteria bacterium]